MARAVSTTRVCALALGCATLCSCALLVPPSWRADAPVPLHGPLVVPTGYEEQSAAMSDAELDAAVEEDQARLMEIISQPRESSRDEGETEAQTEAQFQAQAEAETEELRGIADRLPARQNEARSRRDDDPSGTIRHPVIR